MNKELNEMIAYLKSIGFTVSKIEKELNFSNGVLGKAMAGKSKLNDEKNDSLIKFYEKQMANPGQPIETDTPVSEPKKETATPKEKAKEPHQSYFSKLLLEFNTLVDNQPLPKSIREELNTIYEKAINAELNYRQVDAIRSRVVNYLNGDYGNSRNQLKTA